MYVISLTKLEASDGDQRYLVVCVRACVRARARTHVCGGEGGWVLACASLQRLCCLITLFVTGFPLLNETYLALTQTTSGF
jgi:hypothetical protein